MIKENFLKNIPRFAASFDIFCKECLGFSRKDNLGYKDLTPQHNELIKFLQFDEHKFKLILMPRFTFKSCLITQGYSLWRLVRDPNMRILIYSDSAAKAEGFLKGIKNHILGDAANSSFREYFPLWETNPKDGKWNESEIIVRPRDFSHVEPTMDTGGIETSKVGKHYDLIIFDDIVSDLNITTKAQMDKVYDCYKKSLSLLKPGGDVIIVGTRWAFGDAYGRIIHENKGNFGVFIKQAVVGNDYLFESIGLTKEFLENQKREQGTYIWSCLYQNSPVPDEEMLFKKDQFSFYGSPRIDTSRMFITATVDPAGEGEDFTGITVCGTDNKLNIYILDCVNAKLKLNEIVDEIIRLNYKWGFVKLGVETNFYRGALEKEIYLERDKHCMKDNFTQFSTEIFMASAKKGEGKFSRISSLQPFHERGALLFPGESVEGQSGAFGELAYQMIQYTQNHHPIHDDVLDALAYQIKLIKPGGVVERAKPPVGSLARMELDEYDKMQRMNRHVPRSLRRKMEMVFQ